MNYRQCQRITIGSRYRLYGTFVGLEKYRAEGSRTNTTWLGEEAARNTRILERQPRVISHEQQMRFSQ
ncbi:hypothetical protein ACVXG9_23375 [Escherichia coli]